jgi:hypothetical protein
MLRLIREGLRIYRPVLLSAWSSSIPGVALVFATLVFAGAVDRRHAPSWAASVVPAYLVYASAVAGWIIIGTELAEHRLRLHALLPLPAIRLGLARQLLPVIPLLLGLPLAHAVAAAVQAIFGPTARWPGPGWLDLIAVHLLLALQLTLAVREVIVLRQTRGWRPWFAAPAVPWRRRGAAGRPLPAAEPAGGAGPARRPAGEARDDVHAGAVLAALGWAVVALLVGAEIVLGLPNSNPILGPGIRISAHIGSLAVCTAVVTALALAAAAFTLALFCHRTEIAL